MGLFNRNRNKVATPMVAESTPAPIIVPMALMDKFYDRSAGRFCAVCDVNGSHHTDRHDEFAQAVLAHVA